MIRCKIVVVAAALSALAAQPAFPQAAIQEPGAFEFYHPNEDVLNGGPHAPGGVGVDCSGVCRDRRCEHRHAHGQERDLPARAAGWRFRDPALEQRKPLRACRWVLMPSGAA
jgi:hypothetical protein